MVGEVAGKPFTTDIHMEDISTNLDDQKCETLVSYAPMFGTPVMFVIFITPMNKYHKP